VINRCIKGFLDQICHCRGQPAFREQGVQRLTVVRDELLTEFIVAHTLVGFFNGGLGQVAKA
jgi:hypothetical protein